MASNRRIGTVNSSTRELLMDGVERVMIEDGYAALTARKVAERVGLKHQLVYYYFMTMEDLLIAAYRRRTSQMLDRIESATSGAKPLRSLWEVHSEPAHAALTVEYLALANHNERIRQETVQFGEEVRRIGLDRLLLQPTGAADKVISPLALTLAISSLGAILGMEMGLGITGGHAELRELIDWCFDRLQAAD